MKKIIMINNFLPLILSVCLLTGCVNMVDTSTLSTQKELTMMDQFVKKEQMEVDGTSETYFLQVPQYVQENSYYCSVAALQSVMAYHGIYASQSDLAKDLKTDPVTGTEYEDLARVATKRIFPNGEGKYISSIPSSDKDRSEFENRLIQNIKDAQPIFVSINNRWMYEDVPDQVHQITVIGMTMKGGKLARVTFLDPSYTRQDPVYGGLKACAADELWKSVIENTEPGYVYYEGTSKQEEISNKEDLSERKEANPPIQLEKITIPMVQSVQEKYYYNGPACVQMVLRLHGIEISQDQLARELNTSSSTGTEYADVQTVVNKYICGKEHISEYDFGYKLLMGAETDLLESRIVADMSSNNPVFIALDGNTLYEGKSKGNHLVLIVGYSKFKGTNTIANYYFIDPWDEGQDPVYGGLKIITPEELKSALVNNREPAYLFVNQN